MARVPEIIRRNPVSQVAAEAPRAGQAFGALSEVLKLGAGFVKPAASQQAKEEGQKAVYRDNDGKLKVDERSAFSGEMGAIHNSAAYAKYLGQKQIDVSNTFAELTRQHEFDPAAFKEASDAYISTIRADEAIPSILKDEIVLNVETEANRRFNGLYNAEVDRNYADADKNTKTARDMLVEDYISLYQQGDFEGAEEKWKEVTSISNFRSDAPYIRDTEAETESYLRGARGSAKAARAIRELDDIEGDDSISEEKRSEILSVLSDPDINPQTRQRLYSATQGVLKGIDAAAIVKGMTDSSYEGKLIHRESSGNNLAQAATSSAFGPHQFIKGTWLGLVSKYKPEWAKGLSERQVLALRSDRAKSSEMFAHFRRENAAVLRQAGIPINDGTEYLAHFLGAGDAVKALAADPMADVSTVLPAATIKANSFLQGMSVRGLVNWANRKMTVKASDMAAMGTEIAEIEDDELRGMAAKELSIEISARQIVESAAANEYDERLVNGENVTTQEVLEDHRLSTEDQGKLARAIEKQHSANLTVQQTLSKLNDPSATWDIYDTKDRNAVDDVYQAGLDGEAPLSSQENMTTAAQIAARTGFLPKSMFNALRSATKSTDPSMLATALEYANTVISQQPSAISPYGGRSEIENALSDYRFYSEFGSAEEAAQKVIDGREDVPKNISDQAKLAVKKTSLSDITDHFDDAWLSDPDLGSAMEQDAMLGEYQRLFTEQYIDTGDVDLAKNRALDQFGRIYGMNEVTGSRRVMKFPPQMFYPAVDGSHEWMTDQIETEVSEWAFGEEAGDPTASMNDRLVDGLSMGGVHKWVNSSQIKMVSDATTRSEIMSGKVPSYVVYFMRGDTLEQVPQRYSFDPSGAQSRVEERQQALRSEFEKSQTSSRSRYYDLVLQHGEEVAREMIREEEGGNAVPR